jgi:hypothetical protein
MVPLRCWTDARRERECRGRLFLEDLGQVAALLHRANPDPDPLLHGRKPLLFNVAQNVVFPRVAFAGLNRVPIIIDRLASLLQLQGQVQQVGDVAQDWHLVLGSHKHLNTH